MIALSSSLQEETINFEKAVNLRRADMGSASIPTEGEGPEEVLGCSLAGSAMELQGNALQE